MTFSRQKSNEAQTGPGSRCEGWEGVPWEGPFRNKQAREEQALTAVKMLWANSLVKCCNPELPKLQGTWFPCGKAEWRTSALKGGSGVGWLVPGAGDLTFGVGVARLGSPGCSRCWRSRLSGWTSGVGV